MAEEENTTDGGGTQLLRYKKRYQVLASSSMREFAIKMCENNPDRMNFHEIKWNRFPDGTDHIEIEAYSPKNHIRGEHVLFCASFDNNAVTLSQLYVLIVLCESFVESLTILLPFFPTATMERVVKEGVVATANALSKLLANLPNPGRPIRMIVYDLHTLQNQFYLGNHCCADLRSAVPSLYDQVLHRDDTDINAIAFPDDGAQKRFGSLFEDYPMIVCGKVRDGVNRKVTIKEGSPKDLNVLIVDDLIQTGGTLYECGKVLKQFGAKSVYAFATHGVFPNESWRRFLPDGDRNVFDKVFITNTIPGVSDDIIANNSPTFQVIDLEKQVVQDLYN